MVEICETTETTTTHHSSRERILHAAIQLFARQGYGNTSTLSIARAAGTSETQLMKNFINKQGLLEAVFSEALANIARLLDEVQDLSSPRDKLREFFRRTIFWLHENPDLAKTLFLDMNRIRSKTGGNVVRATGAPDFYHQFDEILQDAREAGQLRSNLRIQLIRSVLIGGVGELIRDSLVAEDALSDGATPAEIEQIVDHLFSSFFR